ncbi:hypothetical protein [Rhizobium leguminosarum]|uniref:hypothetical protein n=1 Tax=Rhizobium leguminosarum TaxID=384 RepID=UPI001C98CB0F|nr:hypothetical protein [Rhizobium leguminosarum]MBY5531575.1 hypothetical protein [Rhizobium leguminosarum]
MMKIPLIDEALDKVSFSLEVLEKLSKKERGVFVPIKDIIEFDQDDEGQIYIAWASVVDVPGRFEIILYDIDNFEFRYISRSVST